MSTQCLNCGFINPPGMRFCGNCGTRLPEDETSIQEATTVSPEQIGAMVGADLLERFRRAGLEAAGQRRTVTVLFADLSDYTRLSEHIDSEELYDLIRQYINLLASDVYKYEGMVDKFTGDGLMALFGAPIAHENNSELAVRSAIDMLNDVAALSREMKDRIGSELKVRIGLHAGPVIVGGIGSNLLMNYTAIGDTVNLAQRLEAATGPGTILVSETVYQQTRALFDFEIVPNLTLKGVEHVTAGYKMIGQKSIPGSLRGIEGLKAPMVGREAEMRQLMQAIGALATYKQGQLVMIMGEAGLGKSRLVSELKMLTHPVPVSILEGQSLIYRRSVTYWVFLDLLRNYLKVTPDTPGEQISAKLRQFVTAALDSRSAEVLPYIEHLMLLTPSDSDAARRIELLDASQLRQQVFLAVRDLLVAEARQRPLVLILEDLHWADEASLGLLRFLLDSISQTPLLILSVTRPFQSGPLEDLAEYARKNLPDRFTIIQLQGLSAPQSEQLLTRLLEIPNLPASLRDQIVQRAAGIPFYLEEILRMLIDQGVLNRVNHQWVFGEGADLTKLGVPDTLQGLILARFDRLEKGLRQVLQIASAIGWEFDRRVLETSLLSVDGPAVRQALGQLVEREFIQIQPDTSDSGFTFKNVLISDAIYSTLLKRDKVDIHGQIGEAIEQVYANRLDSQTDLLAKHYAWSNKRDKALHYLILAGQKSSRGYQNSQARLYFDEALSILSEIKHLPYQAFHVHSGLGDVLILAGEYQPAREHYETALELLGAEDPNLYAEECSDLKRKIGMTYERQGDYTQALVCMAESQRMLDTLPLALPAEKARILNDIGWIHFRHGSVDDAEKNLLAALQLAQDTPRYDLTASIYNRLGGVYFNTGKLELASSYVQKSLALRQEIGDIVAVARSHNNLGLLDWKRGKWDSALENFTRSLELHANLGDVEGAIELQTNLGLLQLDRGHMDEAKKHLEVALATAQKIGHSYIVGVTYWYFSRLYLSLEDWQTALDYSSRSMKILEELGDSQNLVDVHINQGQAWLGLGNIASARQQADKAISLFDQANSSAAQGPAENLGRALRLQGEIVLNSGEYENANKFLEEAAAIFTAVGNQLEQGRSAVTLALLASARSDNTGARVHLNEARLIFRQLGAEQDLRRLTKISMSLSGR